MTATVELIFEFAHLLATTTTAGRREGLARLAGRATAAAAAAVVVQTPDGPDVSVAVAPETPDGIRPVIHNAVLRVSGTSGDGSPARSNGLPVQEMLAGLAPFGVESALAAPFPDGGPAGVLLAFFGPRPERDDTPQRTLEAVARLALAALADGRRAPGVDGVLNALPDAVEVYDAEGRLLQLNARHRQLFGDRQISAGMAQSEVLGALGIVQPPASQSAPAASSGEPQEITLPGPELTVVERVTAPLGDGTAGGGSVALYRDVSRLKRIEKQKDEFLSLASHELKTPLTTIKGYSQMLQRRLRNAAAAGPDAKVDLGRAAIEADQIREEGDRLNRLVDQLLDVSRIQTGRLMLARHLLDLRVLLPETVERLKMALDGRQLVYSAPRERTPLTANADADRLKQVIGNLVENAARYSPADSTIEIRLRLAAGESGQARRAVISVRDRGLGIDGADLGQIFDRFYRAAKPAAVRPLGMGLGLFISREIVRQHGGRIWAESAGQGKGSTFSVELPLEDAPGP